MAESKDLGEAEDSERTPPIVHWFFPTVGLIYGCGYLVVFTFLRDFGIDSVDFVEAKYIHIGVLFIMACSVIAAPLFWIVWPLRAKMPGSYGTRIRNGLRKGDLYQRLIEKPVLAFFRPRWFEDRIHGLHADPPVRLSMILILWSFIMIVMFAPPDFARAHTKLAFFNFLIPIFILLFGLLGDLFKGGKFAPNQALSLSIVRSFLRIWWIVGGMVSFLVWNHREYFLSIVAAIYFGVPLIAIFLTFSRFYFHSDQGDESANMRTRLAITYWVLYALQWAVLIWQTWGFLWTIRSDTLGVSLCDILLGADYFTDFREHLRECDLILPHGAIYFVFLIILIGFFVIRNAYRIKQIGSNDRGHQIATSISLAIIVGPLSYISILAFAHTIYPYIPFEKGGGDYSKCPTIYLTFNIDSSIPKHATSLPAVLLSNNASNNLLILEENSSFVFLAATNDDVGSPLIWRDKGRKPKIYKISRDLVATISQNK